MTLQLMFLFNNLQMFAMVEMNHVPDTSFDGSSFIDAQGKPICI